MHAISQRIRPANLLTSLDPLRELSDRPLIQTCDASITGFAEPTFSFEPNVMGCADKRNPGSFVTLLLRPGGLENPKNQ